MFCLNKISKSGNDCIGWMSEKNRLFIMNKLEQCIYTSSLTRILLLQKIQVNYYHNHQKVLLLYYWFSNYIYIFTESIKNTFQKSMAWTAKTHLESVLSDKMFSRPYFGAQIDPKDLFKTLFWRTTWPPRLLQDPMLELTESILKQFPAPKFQDKTQSLNLN